MHPDEHGLPTGAEFDARTVELCKHAALLVGPMLDVKRREDRWLITKALDSGATHLGHLIGPRHIALKLWVLLIAAVVAFFALVEGDYVITADASLEGSVQRAVTAAMQGYIVEARVRAGDVVRKGDVLAVLDDRDLRLERQKLISQGAQQGSERRQAVAEGNRAKARILEAQAGQVRAQQPVVILRPRAVAVRADLRPGGAAQQPALPEDHHPGADRHRQQQQRDEAADGVGAVPELCEAVHVGRVRVGGGCGAVEASGRRAQSPSTSFMSYRPLALPARKRAARRLPWA